jgi:sucrose phosphorylase
MKNKVQLCTYVDRLSGGGIDALDSLLSNQLKNVFGSVHLLPFYTPIDGADAGFDPSDHTQVDPRLGDWKNIKSLTEKLDVMADVIVNHISADSPQFQDYSEKGDASIYSGLFLTLDSVFPNGAREQDFLALYRPRPGIPLTVVTLKTGEKKILWTTFTSNQIDINVNHPQGEAYLNSILQTFANNGVRQIRLDAVGYAIKKAGASSFMMPETMDFIASFSAKAKALGLEVLVEIHSYYRTQIAIAKQVDWVYDFALPPLVLHAILFNTARYLKEWIAIRPNNAINVLDTHDGIGVIDIGADSLNRADNPGLVPAADLDQLVERIHSNSHNQSRTATGAAASNLDLYQVNCTFYDALGQSDSAYLLARAIQFFMPGLPQVYYVGLLAGNNDVSLLAKTGVGRDINRHYYQPDEMTAALEKPVVKNLLSMIQFRNEHPAFSGQFDQTLAVKSGDDKYLTMRWQNGEDIAELRIHFSNLSFQVFCTTTNKSNSMSTLNEVMFSGAH